MTPHPVQDPGRLAALRQTALLDSPMEEAFDRLTRLAVRLLGAPVALVSLVDADRQFFKSAVGLPEPYASARQTPLTHSFCQHTVNSQKPLIVPDARQHALVKDNDAIRDMGVAAYAGFPLTTAGGHTLGAFCAIDTHPRDWSLEEYEALKDLAALVMAEIELRTTLRQRDELAARNTALAQENARHTQEKAAIQAARERERAALLDATLHGIYGVDARGRGTYINKAGASLLGFAPAELIGREVRALRHPAQADGTARLTADDPIQAALSQGHRGRVEKDTFRRRDGTPLVVEYSVAPVIVEGRSHGAVIAFAPRTDTRAQSRLCGDMAQFTADSLRPPLDALTTDLHRLRPTCKGVQQEIAHSLTHHLADLRARVGELQ